MNSEDKNLENDIEIFSLDDTPINSNNEIASYNQDNVKDFPVNTNLFNNMYTYSDFSDLSMKEEPSDNFNMYGNSVNLFESPERISSNIEDISSVQNAFIYQDAPVDANISTVSMNDEVMYTDSEGINMGNVVETSNPSQSYIGDENNQSKEGAVDSKSNFKFMLIFAIIMLAIIIALPYISGYN